MKLNFDKGNNKTATINQQGTHKQVGGEEGMIGKITSLIIRDCAVLVNVIELVVSTLKIGVRNHRQVLKRSRKMY